MFGVYVHYPYCARHCPYCDFNVAVTRSIPHDDYRDAVLAELAARAPDFTGRPAPVSVYFGGGTPGLWPAGHIGAVIDPPLSPCLFRSHKGRCANSTPPRGQFRQVECTGNPKVS